MEPFRMAHRSGPIVRLPRFSAMPLSVPISVAPRLCPFVPQSVVPGFLLVLSPGPPCSACTKSLPPHLHAQPRRLHPVVTNSHQDGPKGTSPLGTFRAKMQGIGVLGSHTTPRAGCRRSLFTDSLKASQICPPFHVVDLVEPLLCLCFFLSSQPIDRYMHSRQ